MADDWLFDSVVGFLRSPLWTNPIQTYIDENCLVFDGTEENPVEFKKLHDGFRECVDKILEDHLQDMGVSPEQFVEACEKGQNKQLNELVSEYILALDDFLTFKKMMEKRNVEIDLEAIRQSKRMMALSEEEKQKQLEEEERAMLEAAIAASMQEDQETAKAMEMAEAQLQHALAISLQLEQERVEALQKEAEEKLSADKAAEEKKRLEEEHKKEAERIKASFAEQQKESKPAPEKLERPGTAQTATLGSIQLHRHTAFGAKSVLPGIKPSASSAAGSSSAKPVQSSSPVKPSAPTDDEIAKRQAYLKQQRERLIASQKAQRDKEMKEYVEKQKAEKDKPAPAETKAPIDEQQRQMRLALGKRVKEDLIEETRKAAARAQGN
eukprot:TRINITY_DN67148_c4_g2_i1.p1 TRINITY_DN67148_c4_g2~~TRINITY_DN67148_c4_g2_i1.p1  ORF type:complete len:382 (-),score=100.15 TRINITY_DN67148_c4_g2_i1:633-1778(-)